MVSFVFLENSQNTNYKTGSSFTGRIFDEFIQIFNKSDIIADIPSEVQGVSIYKRSSGLNNKIQRKFKYNMIINMVLR